MIGFLLAAYRSARLRLWALRARLRLRRLGMRADIAIAPGVRFETLPRVQVDPYSPLGDHGSIGILIGRGVRLGRDLVVEVRLGSDASLTLGEGTIVHDWCRLQPHAGALDIGRRVTLRDGVHLKSGSRLVVGDRCVLGRDTSVHAAAGVSIGDDTGLAERVSVVDSEHLFDGAGGAFLQNPIDARPIDIGRGVFVGTNGVVLKGSTMADGSVLAANGVLVGAAVPAGHLAGGAPARVLKDLRQ